MNQAAIAPVPIVFTLHNGGFMVRNPLTGRQIAVVSKREGNAMCKIPLKFDTKSENPAMAA